MVRPIGRQISFRFLLQCGRQVTIGPSKRLEGIATFVEEELASVQAGLDIQRSPALADESRDRVRELALALLPVGWLQPGAGLRANRRRFEPDIFGGLAFLTSDEAQDTTPGLPVDAVAGDGDAASRRAMPFVPRPGRIAEPTERVALTPDRKEIVRLQIETAECALMDD